VVVKNVKTGKSQQITALGTSLKGLAVRKKNIMKNVKDDIEARSRTRCATSFVGRNCGMQSRPMPQLLPPVRNASDY